MAINILVDIPAAQRPPADGASHPLSASYGSLGAAQADYPSAIALTDEEDWAAIQSALDRFSSTPGGKLYLPGNHPGVYTAAHYRINRTIRIPTRLVLEGDGWSSRIQRIGRDAGMPLFLTGTPLDPITRGTSLATGSGNCWTSIASELPKKQLNLSDHFDLNGMSAFTFEAFISITSFTNGIGGIIAGSYGTRWGTNPLPPGETVGFKLHLHPTLGTFGVVMTIGGTVYAFNSSGGALTLGQTYYVEVSYNGSTIRLFIDGVQVGSMAATGTITAKYWEDFRVGGDPVSTGFAYKIDSPRVLTVADHTSGYTPPTAKHTVNANTKFLCNFDEFDDRVCCIGFESGFKIDGTAGGDGKGWIFTRDLTVSLLGGVHQFAGLRELRFEDGAPGVIRHFAQHGSDDHLYLFNCRGGYNMRKWSYSNEVRDLVVDGCGTTGIRQEQGSGINRWSRVWLRGGKCGIVTEESYASTFTDLFTYDFTGAHAAFGNAASYGLAVGPWFWTDEAATQPEDGLIYRVGSGVQLGGLGGLFVAGPTIPQMEIFSGRSNTFTIIGTGLAVGTTTPAAIQNPNTPPSGGLGLPPNLLGVAQNRLAGVSADKPWVDSGSATLVHQLNGLIVTGPVAGVTNGVPVIFSVTWYTNEDRTFTVTLPSPGSFAGRDLIAEFVRWDHGLGNPPSQTILVSKTLGAGIVLVNDQTITVTLATNDLGIGTYEARVRDRNVGNQLRMAMVRLAILA